MVRKSRSIKKSRSRKSAKRKYSVKTVKISPKKSPVKKSRSRKSRKNQFLFNPKNPKKSFDVYIDKNPKDTIHIKYTTLEDVKNTINKLEKLYKKKKYTHKRIWQVAMIMNVRLRVLRNKKPKQYSLSNKYFIFLGKRTKLDEKSRYKLSFNNHKMGKKTIKKKSRAKKSPKRKSPKRKSAIKKSRARKSPKRKSINKNLRAADFSPYIKPPDKTITSIIIPNYVTSIGNHAFYDCKTLKSIVIPNSVISIGSGAFNNCRALSSIVIPDSVTSIGNAAFARCESLESIVIPDSTSIGFGAFEGCTILIKPKKVDKDNIKPFHIDDFFRSYDGEFASETEHRGYYTTHKYKGMTFRTDTLQNFFRSKGISIEKNWQFKQYEELIGLLGDIVFGRYRHVVQVDEYNNFVKTVKNYEARNKNDYDVDKKVIELLISGKVPSDFNYVFFWNSINGHVNGSRYALLKISNTSMKKLFSNWQNKGKRESESEIRYNAHVLDPNA